MGLLFGLPAFKCVLLLTNLSMLGLLVITMAHHYKSNNNIYSWSSLFHLLCLSWLCIRGLFWYFTVTSTTTWGESSFELLYWMPNPLQFGSFLLFPLFFAQILYRGKWKYYWTFVRPVYIIALVCIVLFQLFWALLAYRTTSDLNCDDANPDAGKYSNNCSTEHSSAAYRLIAAVCFLILSVCQCLFSFQVAYLDINEYQRHFVIRPEYLLVVNIILLTSFLSKGVYQLGAYLLTDWDILPDIPLQGHADVSPQTVITFELWDYIPTLLLLSTVGASPIQRTVPISIGNGRKRVNVKKIGISSITYSLFASEDDDEEEDIALCNDMESNGPWSRGGPYHQHSPMISPQINPDGFERILQAPITLKSPVSWLSGNGVQTKVDSNNKPMGTSLPSPSTNKIKLSTPVNNNKVSVSYGATNEQSIKTTEYLEALSKKWQFSPKSKANIDAMTNDIVRSITAKDREKDKDKDKDVNDGDVPKPKVAFQASVASNGKRSLGDKKKSKLPFGIADQDSPRGAVKPSIPSTNRSEMQLRGGLVVHNSSERQGVNKQEHFSTISLDDI